MSFLQINPKYPLYKKGHLLAIGDKNPAYIDLNNSKEIFYFELLKYGIKYNAATKTAEGLSDISYFSNQEFHQFLNKLKSFVETIPKTVNLKEKPAIYSTCKDYLIKKNIQKNIQIALIGYGSIADALYFALKSSGYKKIYIGQNIDYKNIDFAILASNTFIHPNQYEKINLYKIPHIGIFAYLQKIYLTGVINSKNSDFYNLSTIFLSFKDKCENIEEIFEMFYINKGENLAFAHIMRSSLKIIDIIEGYFIDRRLLVEPPMHNLICLSLNKIETIEIDFKTLKQKYPNIFLSFNDLCDKSVCISHIISRAPKVEPGI